MPVMTSAGKVSPPIPAAAPRWATTPNRNPGPEDIKGKNFSQGLRLGDYPEGEAPRGRLRIFWKIVGMLMVRGFSRWTHHQKSKGRSMGKRHGDFDGTDDRLGDFRIRQYHGPRRDQLSHREAAIPTARGNRKGKSAHRGNAGHAAEFEDSHGRQ